MTGREIVLEIPAKPEYLQMVRAVVAAAASVDADLESERVHDLRLAVSEATTNAIEAHAQMGSSERITIRLEIDDERIAVEVRDHGDGFDPDNTPELPDPEDPARLLHENGLGVRLMRYLADETEILSGDDGTRVRMIVYVPADKRRL